MIIKTKVGLLVDKEDTLIEKDNKKKNLHEGHRDRMKSEFLEYGLENMSKHKIIELLLFYSVPRCDVNNLAHELINKYKTISGVLDAPVDELIKFKGITLNNVGIIKMIMPIAREYLKEKEGRLSVFKNVEEIGNYLLKRYIGFTNERFSVLCLNSSGQCLGFKTLKEGDISAVGVSTRDVVEFALKTNANCVIISHNHPSGIALPSNEDIAITKQVRAALSYVGVALIDHIIVANNDFVSLHQTKKYNSIFTD